MELLQEQTEHETKSQKAADKMVRVAAAVRKISELHDKNMRPEAQQTENQLYRDEFPGTDVPYPEADSA